MILRSGTICYGGSYLIVGNDKKRVVLSLREDGKIRDIIDLSLSDALSIIRCIEKAREEEHDEFG